MFFKLIWFLRALLYRPFFGELKWPSYLGKPVYIKGAKNIFVGKRVRIYPQIRLETHYNGRINIKDNVGIAQNVHITSMGDLEIGEGTTILANVFITNIIHSYKEVDIPILNQPMILAETTIGKNCFIGIGASIQAGTRLGNQCIVGANSVVKGEFPNYCVLVGVPAKIIKQYNPTTKVWETVK
ncbi:DapH/DapD/GlmU-related protein [Parapedobacter sp. DT-150]|uniref:DapH/DapD/GlmU-related protein n=1 Tax=Parapedobacter sp. DT-150 TaxID=3396162 RepID=UPI003F1AA93F